ncbi:MAG TPA: DNA-processing protein DprA [Actinomycetota bacterium]|nr:DNA-processing protein DprA [Actinomycetota bacterium]
MPAERATEDQSVPSGFPDGFGVGPDEADAVLLLRCLQGISPRALHRSVWLEGSASATLASIVAGSAGSDRDRAWLDTASAPAVRAQLARAGARFARPGDPEYWPALLRLSDPPVGIFCRGRSLSSEHRRVAIVGSRRPSPAGVEVARSLARGVVRAGLLVTSGGALGIDARAHEGALDAGGSTVAVLGCGIDRDYPATNRELLRKIERRGTLVSEYPPGVPAEPFRFPARNRLIAALSIGVVIVEGVAHSGTRSTADFASQVGIDVFGVPGTVTSMLSQAPNALIRDGARLVRSADDLLDDLGIEPSQRAVTPEGLPASEALVLAVLERPMMAEEVARAAGLGASEAITALMGLEMRGLIKGEGGRYRPTADNAVNEPVPEPG